MTCLKAPLAYAALALASAANVIAASEGQSYEWLSVHGGVSNQRYVPFDQISLDTVAQLGAIWVSDSFADGASSRMTPLVHDRLMFFGAGPRIYALDARNGKPVWVRQTETRRRAHAPALGFDFEQMISGLAITRSWGLGLGGGLIFAGMMNGHVMALREKTGEVLWDALINQEPLAVSKGITCTPLYIDGVLYFGFGQETSQGHAVAVDAQLGRVLWRVPTVPEPGQPGHESWPRDSEIWRSGGAHPWVPGAGDPALGLVYYVTGNPGPASGGAIRPGDNLYSDSVIALEMKTGKLRWYRQLVHHDVWEADLSVSPVLFDIDHGPRRRKAVAVMRADGYVFVFDRATGEPLTPMEERPVPQNPLVFTSPTQPFPRGGDSILPPCESWRGRLPAGFVLGCMYDPPSLEVPNRLAQWASVRIAPMSYSQQTGYFYAQGHNSVQWRTTAEDPYLGDITNVNGTRVPNFPRQTAVIAAVDGRTGKVMWRKELPSFDDSGYKSNGGALSTAGGLVFHQGGDGTLQAYDARSGETLWRFQTDFAVGDASPMSYAIDGKQYVAFIAGSKIWSFALGGKLPQAPVIAPPAREEAVGPIEDTNEIETSTLEQAPANGHRYRLNEYAFNPYRTRIRAGSQVTFINNGHRPRTIVARDGSWTTGTLAPTQIATLKFDKPASYLYYPKESPWSSGQLIVVSATPGSATPPASTAHADQVSQGKNDYAETCSACHGQSLGGRDPAPALQGTGFTARWAGRDALDLFDRIRTTMPPAAPSTLSDASYAAIVAYILYANDNPAAVALDRVTMKGLTVTTKSTSPEP